MYNLVIAQTHSGSVWKVTWAHPEFGQVLASCSFDRTAAVWEEQGTMHRAQIMIIIHCILCVGQMVSQVDTGWKLTFNLYLFGHCLWQVVHTYSSSILHASLYCHLATQHKLSTISLSTGFTVMSVHTKYE